MLSSATDSLRLADFDYDLPEQLIAQEPAAVRDGSRLMILNRNTGSIEHHIFRDLERFLVPGDLLVVNNTRVFPCRLAAKKQGGGKAEIFLLTELALNHWNALVRGGLKKGMKVSLEKGIDAEIVADRDDGTRDVLFRNVEDIRTALAEIGKTPLPPYIKREAGQPDRERYQTVYAEEEGAVAAPTAGLHFTQELLSRLAERGIESASLTLHVGPGTFQPVKSEIVTDHRMLPETYLISETTAAAVNRARSEHRRVIAVGTTSVRAMESAASEDGVLRAGRNRSLLFIYPGYRFRVISGLITNFHLPKSTLLMLVSALAGRDRVLNAYRIAVSERYRFYSYGDAMLIL